MEVSLALLPKDFLFFLEEKMRYWSEGLVVVERYFGSYQVKSLGWRVE